MDGASSRRHSRSMSKEFIAIRGAMKSIIESQDNIALTIENISGKLTRVEWLLNQPARAVII